MSDPTCAQSWSELLLALPEFDLIHAHVDPAEELHATVACPATCKPARRVA